MDNISHSVVSLAVGELIHRTLPAEVDEQDQKIRHRLFLLGAAAAGNFPDLDLVLSPLMPSPLGYLLYHRGHTHTFLFAIPQAILLFAVIWLLWPLGRDLLKKSGVAQRGLAISLCLGILIHIGMDYWNSYGVHPFYPFNSNWYFGDFVFIVEPFIWAIFGIPMALLIGNKALRFLLCCFLLAFPAVAAAYGLMPWISTGLIWILSGLLAWFQLKELETGRQTLALSIGFGLALLIGQKTLSNWAKEKVSEALQKTDSTILILDIALTPLPGHPVCWNFVSVEKQEERGIYQLKQGALSLLPSIVLAEQCPQIRGASREGRKIEESLLLFYEWNGQLELIRRLARENCHFNAWLRFARAPIVTESEATDLRFQQGEGGRNFSYLSLEKINHFECSQNVPQWSFPRQDLLN